MVSGALDWMGYRMLTDTKIRNLKPTGKLYKVADRDGLYVAVTAAGSVSFRYNYSINGRQETVTIGRYGPSGLTLAEARERLMAIKKQLADGISPAREKARRKEKVRESKTFGAWADDWLDKYKMAESTRDMRRSVYERDLKGKFGRCMLEEISEEDVRALCDGIVARGAPAVAVHAREVVMNIYEWARLKGQKVANPAKEVRPSSIATFEARDRSLSPEEIGLLYKYLERVATTPAIRAAVRLTLLTMLRKGELVKATWDEINFTNATWTIPGPRMKRKNPHVVYLSKQALDILMALKLFAGGSRYVLPSRYDPDLHMSMATLNQVTTLAYKRAQKDGEPLGAFTVHDLRRTASTLLHEAGYNSDWIEKCLAHEQKGVRAVYNKAEYAEQRRGMLQDWADMIDSFTGAPAAAAA